MAKKASLQSSVEASECEDSKVDMVEQEEDCYIHSISGKDQNQDLAHFQWFSISNKSN